MRPVTWSVVGQSTAGGFLAGNTQPLAAFPQGLTTDSQFLGQFGLAHPVLILQNKVLEIVLQRQVAGRIRFSRRHLLVVAFDQGIGDVFVVGIAVQVQYRGRYDIAVGQDGRTFDGVFQFPDVTGLPVPL